MDRELLIEVGVEELPAAWLPSLTRQLSERLAQRLRDFRISAEEPVESYSTPRRLTARVPKIAERQEDLEEEIMGPPVSAAFKDGQPTPAALGFAKKQGVEFDQVARVQTPKGEYLAYTKRQRGKSAVDTLPDLLTAVLRDLQFPKQMHWDARLDDGKDNFVFGRPIRWLLFIYGGRVVPFTIGRSAAANSHAVQEVESGALTYGHRFLATSGRAGRSIKVRSFDEYRARLSEHFVVLDHADRRDRIFRELEKHARRLGGRVHLKEHAALIDEVADLVEYPGVVAGFFDRGFLELPPEVLTTTLVHHQHWFPVLAEDGKLKEAFLAVVNTQPVDERTIAKNAERVVTARLRDAKFFWEADRKVPLESRLDRLHTVVFHKKLGSYRDKVERVSKLAEWIAREAFARPDVAEHASNAGQLSKADLTTDMVFEFPELQGTMGGIYAREEGKPEQVWKAIYYHYLPIGVEADAPPTREQLGSAAVTWAALSLADKLDTVVGLFAAGERPTGSRDPFGIRRNAQGAVRVLMDLPELTGLDREIPLGELLDEARRPFQTLAANVGSEQLAYGFWHDRILFALEQRGFSTGESRAVLTTTAAPTSLGDKEMFPSEYVAVIRPLKARRVAEGLRRMRGSDDLLELAKLFKRVKNIAKELKERAPLDRGALTEPAERALLDEIDRRRPVIEQAAKAADYRKAFTEIAALRAAVDRFFTEVFVMADDPRLRNARLTLMADLRDLILQFADISEIVPKTE